MKIRDRIRELRRVPASTLIPNPKNWRQHPKRQQNAMMAVLQEVGYADALLAREDDNGSLILIDGHLRAGITPETMVPVLVLDVDETEADKILATLDPLAGMAVCDVDALRKLAGSIEALVPDFGELLLEISPDTNRRNDEDSTPPVLEEAVTQPGDLWLLGSHRLLCGNATDAADVSKLLGAVKPLLMATDPPYGVNYRPSWRNDAARAGSISYAARREGEVANDDRVDWSAAYALFPGSVVYLWHASLYGSEVQQSLERCGFNLRSQIIWAKARFAISRGHYHWQHECCFYAVRKGATGHWRGDRSQTTLWQVDGIEDDDAKNNHGTPKPVEIMRRPILNHTNPGQAVYDPFVGSGTTIIAAEGTARVCFALELDPRYVDVCIKRWQNYSGQTARLESEDRTFEEIARQRRVKGEAALKA